MNLRATFSLWLQACLLLPFDFGRCEQHIFTQEARVRNATLEDVEDIATVINAAFSTSPSWQYIYQFSQKFPEEHRKCSREAVTQLLSDESAHIEVIQALPDSGLAVIATAIWRRKDAHDLSYLHLVASACMHRDLNVTRTIDYDHKFTAAKRKYLDDRFGANQLYLQLLTTHPDHQLHGAGTQLVNSGLELGRKANVNVTLISEPTAETFYLRFSFTSVANISIASVDGDQAFRFNVMAHKPDRLLG